MTRGSLLIVTVLVLAVAGMFFWVLDLSQRLEETPEPGIAPPEAPSDVTARLERLERRVEDLEISEKGDRTDIAEISRGIRELESRLVGGGMAALEEGAPAEPSPVAAPGEASLREAVENVLAQRDAEERQQRYARMAGFMSNRLLAEIQVTDQQRKQFEAAIVTYLTERDEVREKYSGPDADRQARDVELDEVTEQRNAKLLQILGQADYAKIEESMNRFRRGDVGRGGRGGPGRGR